jgi:hypothetical protein
MYLTLRRVKTGYEAHPTMASMSGEFKAEQFAINSISQLDCRSKSKEDFNISKRNRNINGKAIPLLTLIGPAGSRRLRLQMSRKSTHEGGKVVSPTHRPPLPPIKY